MILQVQIFWIEKLKTSRDVFDLSWTYYQKCRSLMTGMDMLYRFSKHPYHVYMYRMET